MVLLVALYGFAALLFLLPHYRENVDLFEVFGVSLGLGYAAIILLSLPLSLFDQLRLDTLLALSVVYFSVCLFGAWKRNPTFHTDFLGYAKSNLKTVNVPLLLVTAALLLSVLYPIVLGQSRDSFSSISSIGYMSGTKSLVQNQGIPEFSMQYGVKTSPIVNKMGFNHFTAALKLLSTLDYIPLMRMFTIFCTFWLSINVIMYFKELHSYKVSLIGLILVIMNNYFNGLFVGKFDAYRAEAFGVAIMFVNLYLFLKWYKYGDKRFGLVSIIVSTMQAITHLASFIPFALFTGSYFVVDFTYRKDFRLIKDFAVHYIKIILFIAIIMLSIGTYPEYLKGMGGSEKNETDVDLTYEFRSYLSGSPSLTVNTESFFTNPVSLFKALLARSSRSKFFRQGAGQVILYIAVLSAASMFISRRENRINTYSSLLFLVVLYAFGLVFNFLFDSWVYATFVERRIFPYVFLTLVNIPANVVDCKDEIDIQFHKRKISLKNLYIIILLLSSFLIHIPSFSFEMGRRSGSRISPVAMETLLWLKDNAEPGSVVLTNDRTTGVYYLFSDLDSMFEGRAPYFEPELIRGLLELFYETEGFFNEPDIEFLEKYNVTYIVANPTLGISFGGNKISPLQVNIERLNSTSFLTPVLELEGVSVFKVNGET